ncbi:hypothetical protein JEQ12_009617 [Ovis aries]|uniref:Uncharacterized protein n=1 Tax=Ovis aries TaxID=9940 RepID=A0A836D5K6_SHEEP|nr:hypothetical protein JEQ12_009617 [Ovis aries]
MLCDFESPWLRLFSATMPFSSSPAPPHCTISPSFPPVWFASLTNSTFPLLKKTFFLGPAPVEQHKPLGDELECSLHRKTMASLGGIAYPTGQDHIPSRRILNHRGSQAPLTESERKKRWVHVMWVKTSCPQGPAAYQGPPLSSAISCGMSAVFSFLTALASVLHQVDFSVWRPLQMNGLAQRPGPCKWQISSE